MVFLSAEWRKLVMANYIVPQGLLQPFVPRGTEIDLWQGKCYMSLVGFMFLNTRVLGVPVPFHQNFEEVNLRFYVGREVDGIWRRGVVFIREIVPKPAISLVANWVYAEHYVTHRMWHHWELTQHSQTVTYEWGPYFKDVRYCLSAVTEPVAEPIGQGTETEFITEHYWGYAKASGRRTFEYEVQHPRWEAYPVRSCMIWGDFSQLYGPDFGTIIAEKPASVFVADGSAIRVLSKRTLIP